MHEFGYTVLLFTLVLTVFGAVASVVGHRRGQSRLQQAGFASVFAVAGLLTVASLALIYLFLAQDFSIKYVQHYSDRSMPLFYVITAFWGGQEGSLLFWAWVLSLYSAAAVWINREHVRLIPYASAVLLVITGFFTVLMVFEASPFETFLGAVPAEGRGLNPLLQNPYMVTHPPALYLGYIGMSIPFAFGIAALASGKLDETWIRLSRKWSLVAWFFLSVGLVLGKIWAYEELGWGGYWAWDPVENAGLLPWLTATAFVHSIMIQERRGMFKNWNMFLVIISFSFTIVGTFLTRSGVVQSVHAFAQSDIGYYFIGFLLLALGVSFGLMIYRHRELASTAKIESMLSREFAFSLNNWIFVGMAFFVLIATIFPSITKGLMGEKITVGPPFYNRWMVPLGLVLLFLTGVGPLISWRKASGDSIRKQFTWPLVTGVVFTGIALAVGALSGGVATVINYGLVGFVSGTIFQEFIRGTRVRMRNTAEGPFDAFVGLMSRAKRRYGGYVIHFGVVLMFFGWAGSSYKQEKEVRLDRGQLTSIGDYQIRYDDLRLGQTAHREEITAVLTVLDGAGKVLGTQAPAKWFYTVSGQPTTEVSIRTGLLEDLYLVLGNFDSRSGSIMLHMVINPFTIWVWLGSMFLVIGTVISLWPDRHKKVHLGGRGAATVALAALLLGGALAWSPAAFASGTAVGPIRDVPLPPELEVTYTELGEELVCLCPTCPPIPVGSCGCGWAQDRRIEIRERLAAGASKGQIIDFYVKKDGRAVLSSPPDEGFFRLAWAIPYAALGLGALGLGFAGRSWAKRGREGGAETPADMKAPEIDMTADEADTYRDRLADELEDLD